MSFAPKRSNLSSSMSSSSHRSIPPSPKPASKGLLRSQPQQKSISIDDPLIKRIALLEDVVSNLQLQHDTFLPLLQIVDRVGDVLNLEEQAQFFISSAADLEIVVARQAQSAKESYDNTDNIIMPTSISEGTGLSCRSLPEIQTSLSDIEASMHSMSAKRKVNLKKQEVQCKEELLKIMQEIDLELQDVKKEVIELQSNLVSSGFKEFEVLDAKDQEVRGRVKTGMRQIEIALEEHALYGGKGGDNWLLEELSHRVDDAVKELMGYLEHKYRKFENGFKQEFGAIKQQFEKMRDETHQIESIKNAVIKPNIEITQLIERNRKIFEILEEITTVEYATIDDIIVNLNENLVELNEKARNFVKELKSTAEEQRITIFAAARVDFDTMLKGSLAEIGTLQEILQGCKISSRAELLRLDENIDRIEVLKSALEAAGSKIRVEDSRPRQTRMVKLVDERQKSMDKEAEDLQQRLMGIWKGLNHEASLGIDFVAKKPELQELYLKVEESLTNNS